MEMADSDFITHGNNKYRNIEMLEQHVKYVQSFNKDARAMLLTPFSCRYC